MPEPLKIYAVTHTRVAMTTCYIPATSEEEAEQFMETDTFSDYMDSDAPDAAEDDGDRWKLNGVWEDPNAPLTAATWDYQKDVLPALKDTCPESATPSSKGGRWSSPSSGSPSLIPTSSTCR
jgi:hypothetical protein